MFNRTMLFVPAAVILASFAGVSTASAQNQSLCYTLSSLQGTYAVIGNYGASVGIALGRRTVAADGSFTAAFVVNEPKAGSTAGERTLVNGTQTGSISLNCDGTGVVTRNLTLANGSTSTGTDDFVVTGAVVSHGQLRVTSIVDAQRTPSTIVPGGVFLARTWTRLPDWADVLGAIPLMLPAR